MTIDPLSSIQQRAGSASPEPLTGLDARVKNAGPATDNLSANAASPADYEAFYAALQGQDEAFDALTFLKNYVSADGDKTFRTTAAQMEVLQQAMAQLKAEGQIESEAYKSAMKAFGSAFSMNFMLAAYMRDAMNPSDDEDSRENMEW